METSEQISSDLRAVLAEKHTFFEFLNAYKGIPVICRSALQKVENQVAFFQVRIPDVAVLENAKTTQILSEGLLEPIEAQIISLDLQSGKVGLSKFKYAGSRLSNRKELRVEIGEKIDMVLVTDGQSCAGQLVDISMRGIGALVSAQEGCQFGQNKVVDLTLRLPEGESQISGRIRNMSSSGEQVRLSIEFTGAGSEKILIVRYILHRRSEIYAELQQILADYEKLR